MGVENSGLEIPNVGTKQNASELLNVVKVPTPRILKNRQHPQTMRHPTTDSAGLLSRPAHNVTDVSFRAKPCLTISGLTSEQTFNKEA
jgi:hypothetical protein